MDGRRAPDGHGERARALERADGGNDREEQRAWRSDEQIGGQELAKRRIDEEFEEHGLAKHVKCVRAGVLQTDLAALREVERVAPMREAS